MIKNSVSFVASQGQRGEEHINNMLTNKHMNTPEERSNMNTDYEIARCYQKDCKHPAHALEKKKINPDCQATHIIQVELQELLTMYEKNRKDLVILKEALKLIARGDTHIGQIAKEALERTK